MNKLAEHIGTVLREEAAELSVRWRARISLHAPRTVGKPTDEDLKSTRAVIDAIADAIVGGPSWQNDLMRRSWEIGTVAHRSGVAVHYMLKEIDLLLAMVLYACECALQTTSGLPSTGMDIARKVHEAASLLRLTAVKAFTHAYVNTLRDRYRTLRHDLRNPLGTIKSAITLMDDISVPIEMRLDPRFRTMAVRNALALDALIGNALSDNAAHELAFAHERISLFDIALAVRRDLRGNSNAAKCNIEIAEDLPVVSTDPIGFELVLKEVLVTLLAQLPPKSILRVAAAESKDRSVIVIVTHKCEDPDGLPPGTVLLAPELSLQTGVRVWTAGPVYLEVPGVPVRILED